ncbi:hypothetical protein Tsubulata_027784 [Turnera subulata]|uniref:BHLH domain-containing protein n=1 Tax=Turnera subulata TaxID=218843 RepID=A0A9Q0G003_9ROSI|nr:hypothetical protein Tsubulata_027784 [Turnera subulata]
MDVGTAAAVQVGQKRGRMVGGGRNSKGTKNGDFVGSGSGESSEHEMHIWTERERRKRMRNMFSSLHALLPQLPPKADKSTVVDEAIKYIKTLQQTLQTLQKKRNEKYLQGSTTTDQCEPSSVITALTDTTESSREAFLALQGPSSSNNYPAANASMGSSFSLPLSPACFQTWFSPNVVINMCGDDAQFCVCSPKKPGLLTTIFYILEKHSLDVVSTHISSDQYRCLYMIQAHVSIQKLNP